MLNEIDARGLWPNEVRYGALLNGFYKHGVLVSARNILKKMKLDRISPSHIAYTMLIEGMCKMGSLGEVVPLLEEMFERSICLDVISYSVLLNGFCKAGMLNTAMEILRSCESEKAKKAKIQEVVQSESSLTNIKVVERCFGPQRKSHIVGFGGGITFVEKVVAVGSSAISYYSMNLLLQIVCLIFHCRGLKLFDDCGLNCLIKYLKSEEAILEESVEQLQVQELKIFDEIALAEVMRPHNYVCTPHVELDWSTGPPGVAEKWDAAALHLIVRTAHF
ncbi:PREDICTED: pentatricopeptide repeat-containing protein At1g12775, mitochondrial-like [Nicotiana attenuata]|uniref:pentatricopeptide repeat-containing protein At1g12775, mitochondrial-like n=1 Tax=Nicotiana attenuata TaxID=49451 RepID=UPI000904E846|nr:PREDICTED: pentatricopeptide repeat-containing protein At1g12775, mitochondrial-like [Nicotiana attenuata]